MAIYVSWLVDAARMAAQGTGKQVIVQSGWQSRGHGGMRVVEGVVGHHTATSEAAPGDYPSLNVVQNGRAGLSGPLSHYGLGRSGNIYVIAAGLCYHAGASAYAGFRDLNDEFLGIEAEDSGDGKWNAAQLFMYPRLVHACLHYMRRGVDRYASHRTVAVPAGRKTDPAGISDQWMRQQAASLSVPQETEVSVFPDINDQNNTYAAVRNLFIDAAGGSRPELVVALDQILGLSAMKATLNQVAAAVSTGDAIDSAELITKISAEAHDAVQKAVADSMLPAIERLQAALDDDNAQEAATIVNELARRLRPTESVGGE